MGTSESAPGSLSHTAVARWLRERKGELIEAYVLAARSELEAARSVDREGLIDNLPELLDNLEEALQEGESVANLRESAQIGMKHGQHRARQPAYSLNAVLVEYRLLGRVLFTALRQEGRPEFQTEDLIQDALHRGIANAASEFTRVRSEAEKERLAERERIFQELHDFFMQAPVALCILSGPEHVYTLANPLFLQTSGRNPLGKKVREAFTEAEAGNFFKILDEVYQTGVPHIGKELPFPRETEDGTVTQLYLNIGYHPFRGGDGRIKGILALVQDVTEQVQARQRVEQSEAALRQVTEQLRLVADSVPIHLCQLDRDERFLFVNKAAAEMWRLPPEQFLGRTIREVAGEEAQRALQQYTRRVLRGEVVSYESPFQAPDGSLRTFLNTYTPYRAPDGTIQGFLASGLDITERKRAEEAIRQSFSSLEEERELRERFVSTLAHDLRTPLTAARMSAQLLVRGMNEPARLQQLAGRIADNIDRADQMIRDLLDANRLKAGERLPLEVERCSLNEVASQTLEELSSIHGERFVLQAPAPIEGSWSRGGIRRLLENLCGNGVKYGAPHHPVTVSLAEEGGWVRIEVHNEGTPISADELPHLFELFHRSSTARASGERGWGLGLALVKGIAEAHGGTVSVRSAEGQGTTFTVRLPR